MPRLMLGQKLEPILFYPMSLSLEITSHALEMPRQAPLVTAFTHIIGQEPKSCKAKRDTFVLVCFGWN